MVGWIGWWIWRGLETIFVLFLGMVMMMKYNVMQYKFELVFVVSLLVDRLW